MSMMRDAAVAARMATKATELALGGAQVAADILIALVESRAQLYGIQLTEDTGPLVIRAALADPHDVPMNASAWMKRIDFALAVVLKVHPEIRPRKKSTSDSEKATDGDKH